MGRRFDSIMKRTPQVVLLSTFLLCFYDNASEVFKLLKFDNHTLMSSH
jgi:hypothetical protein